MRDLAGSAWGRSGWSPPSCLAWWHGKHWPGPRGKEKPSRELGMRLQQGPPLEPVVPSSRSVSLLFLPALGAALHVGLVTPREMKFFPP